MAKKNRANRRDASSNRAAIVAEMRRQELARRRRARMMTITSVLVAVVLIAAAVVYAGLHSKTKGGKSSTLASASVVKAVTSVPASVFDDVRAGTVSDPPKAVKASALTKDGKPQLLYVGAEYCPYCAADRWALTAALSRFGTFKNLGQTSSSSSDVYPNTATLSFHGASYTSKYVTFTGYETQSNKLDGSSYATLDTVPSADEKIVEKYDAPPYVSSENKGAIPFVFFGGKYMVNGSPYSPQILAGMTHAQIATAMSEPSSTVGKAIIGSANTYTAAICAMTDDQPSNVCSSSGVTTAAKKLGS